MAGRLKGGDVGAEGGKWDVRFWGAGGGAIGGRGLDGEFGRTSRCRFGGGLSIEWNNSSRLMKEQDQETNNFK